MSKEEIIETLKQDILDLKGLLSHEQYVLNNSLLNKQARGIMLNIQDHLKDFMNIPR